MIFFLSIQCVEDEWKTMAMIRMHWRSHFLPIIADVCHWARSRKQNMIKSSFTTAKKLSTYSMYLWCLVQKLVTSFISRLVLHHTKHVCQIYYNTKTWKLCIMLGFSNHFQLFFEKFLSLRIHLRVQFVIYLYFYKATYLRCTTKKC